MTILSPSVDGQPATDAAPSGSDSIRRLRVAVLSGYPAVRAGLAVLLSGEPGFQVTSFDPIGPVDSEGVDVLVVDQSSLDEAVDWRHDYARSMPLVFVGAEPQAEWPDLGLGPVAFLSEDADSTELISAVHAVNAGLMVIDPEIAATSGLRWRGTSPAIDPTGEPLTPRELEVLRLVADGLPNKTIAHNLGISEHTVKFHVGSLLAKLNAASRTEAVTVATRRGLLAI